MEVGHHPLTIWLLLLSLAIRVGIVLSPMFMGKREGKREYEWLEEERSTEGMGKGLCCGTKSESVASEHKCHC